MELWSWNTDPSSIPDPSLLVSSIRTCKIKKQQKKKKKRKEKKRIYLQAPGYHSQQHVKINSGNTLKSQVPKFIHKISFAWLTEIYLAILSISSDEKSFTGDGDKVTCLKKPWGSVCVSRKAHDNLVEWIEFSSKD